MSEEQRVCRKCHLELPLVEFVLLNQETGNRRPHCRGCENARMREYYAQNAGYREKVRERTDANRGKYPRTAAQQRAAALKHKYGITPEQYDQMLAQQGGKCALCKSSNSQRGGKGKKWSGDFFMVDHCHTNGHVRGLLCHTCNTRLGSHESLMLEVGEAAVFEYLTSPSPMLALALNDVVAPAPRFVETLPPKAVFVAQSCSVDGCENASNARGLCQKHYRRFQRRNGDVGGAENLPRQTPRGASHPKSKLTDDIVREIRSSSDTGAAVAVRFGITPTLVSKVRQGKVWRHVI